MQTIWDLLPAGIWPTQPFISPEEAARTVQMLLALRASANSSSPAAIGPDIVAGAPWTRNPSPTGLASGGEDLSGTSADAGPPSVTNLATADSRAQGGILGSIFGETARSPLATNPGMSLLPTPHRRPFAPVPAIPANYGQAAQPVSVDDNPFAGASQPAPALLRVDYHPVAAGKGVDDTLIDDPTGPWPPIIGADGRPLPEPPPLPKALGLTLRQDEPRLTGAQRRYWRAQHKVDTGPDVSPDYIKGPDDYFPEVISRPASRLGPNIRDAAAASKALYGQTWADLMRGRPASAVADFVGGGVGYFASPLTGFLHTLGQEATEYTANPNFGNKVELLAPFVTPVAATRLAWPRAPTSAANQAALLVVRPSDLAETRALFGVPDDLHTVAVARTDVPGLENVIFRGGSARVRKQAGLPPSPQEPIASPSPYSLHRAHAEEDIANQFVRAIGERGLRPSDLDGHTLVMRISNPRGVCYACLWGLDGDGPVGVLKQLSDKYPRLTIRVEVQPRLGATQLRSKDIVINNGLYATASDE